MIMFAGGFMIKYDCHVHSDFSDDSEASFEEQIEAAIALGLEGICFTDHCDIDYPSTDMNGYSFVFDTSRYIERLNELKTVYADRISILTGIELGLRDEADVYPYMKEKCDCIVKEGNFDFVIGSVHCLEHTDPYYDQYWKDKSAREGLLKYLQAILFNVKNYDCFNSLGHLDYLVRYMPVRNNGTDIWEGPSSYVPSDYMDIIDEILITLINKGKALECNSAGLKYGIGFAHPKIEILKRYHELGGELITIGSDSHKPEHMAYDFKPVCDMLRSVGFKFYSVYEAGIPVGFTLY